MVHFRKSDLLRAWLKQGGVGVRRFLPISTDPQSFDRILAEVRAQHPELSETAARDRALYRIATKRSLTLPKAAMLLAYRATVLLLLLWLAVTTAFSQDIKPPTAPPPDVWRIYAEDIKRDRDEKEGTMAELRLEIMKLRAEVAALVRLVEAMKEEGKKK